MGAGDAPEEGIPRANRFFIDNGDKIIKLNSNFTVPRPEINHPGPIFVRRNPLMVEVTPAATQQVAEYFKDKDPSPIRIFLNSGG